MIGDRVPRIACWLRRCAAVCWSLTLPLTLMLTLMALTMTGSLRAQAGKFDARPTHSINTIDSITAAAIARHIGVIAHDSMGGRDTPSRGLEQTAQYVADQFKALGLEPFDHGGGWIQRYPLPGHAALSETESGFVFFAKVKRGGKLVVNEGGDQVWNSRELDFRVSAVLAVDTVLDYRAPGDQGNGQGSVVAGNFYGPPPVVVAGPHTPASVRQANLRNKVVVYIPAVGTDSATQRQIVQLLHATNHVIVVVDDDSAAFAARRHAAQAHPPVILDWFLPEARQPRHWVVDVWAPAIASGLVAAGVDVAAARAATTPIIRALSAVTLLRAAAADSAEADATTSAGPESAGQTAPNTVGILPGADRRQAIVVTAHMDRTGQHGRTDSAAVATAADDADDNAAGVAALLALAKALAQSGQTFRRSIVFAAVSGGAKPDLWGSHALVERWERFQPGNKLVLNINLDRLGQGRGDSVLISGLRDVDLPSQPAWLAAQHPEWHLTVVDDGSGMARVADHRAFVEKLVPSLYVHRGTHGATAGAGGPDRPSAADAEGEARIVRFLLALTREIADAPTGPHWTSEGRQQRIRVFGRE